MTNELAERFYFILKNTKGVVVIELDSSEIIDKHTITFEIDPTISGQQKMTIDYLCHTFQIIFDEYNHNIVIKQRNA